MNEKSVWDKTNIGENYPGTTSPLTYSFIRDAYEQVYPRFLKLIGVDKKILRSNNHVFDNMLGYINGEVFYNINNWYELVKMLPGYKYNKRFFENMLRPAKNKKEDTEESKFGIVEAFHNRKIIFGFLSKIIFINASYMKFDNKYHITLKEYAKFDLKRLNNLELVGQFKNLKRNFLDAWQYTIVNDFRVMVYFGVLTRFIQKRFKGEKLRVAELMLGSNVKPYSFLPLQAITDLAQKIRDAGLDSKEDYLKDEEIKKAFDEYLDKFGTRAFNELKLEDKTFQDEPELLSDILQQYLEMDNESFAAINDRFNHQERDAEQLINSLSKLDSLIFNYLYTRTVASVHKREEFRFKRGKVFSVANDFFKEIAERLVEYEIIDEVNDIYYLYTEEVFGILNNHRLQENFKAVIENRKSILKKYSNNPLPIRVTTQNIYGVKTDTDRQEKTLKGSLTSKGSLDKAEAVVMPELDLSKDVKNKVLVTNATDPGWTVIFPLLKGIVIQTGGMLSHASILAREMGIPCIVVPNAMSLISDGDKISLDASSEEIRII